MGKVKKLKKLIALLSCVAVLVCFSVPAFAGVYGEDLGEFPWVSTAPVVDAVMDDIYADAYHMVIDHLEPGCIDTGITADVWFCWHGDYIYAFYQVYDPDVVTPDPERSKNPWSYDNVEFFVDYSASCYSDSLTGATQDVLDQCIQYRIDVSGYPSVYGKDPSGDSWSAYGKDASAAGASCDDQGRYADSFFQYAGNFASDIYTVEYAIPLSNTHITWGTETIEVGDVFSINIQVTDFYTGGSDTARLRCEGVDDWAWDAQYWPNFTLGAPDGEIVDNTPSTDVDETPSVDVDVDPIVDKVPSASVDVSPKPNAQTADVTGILYVLASLSAVAGFAVSKKR